MYVCLVKHNSEINHDSNFKDYEISVYMPNKKCLKISEYSSNLNYNTIKQRVGFSVFGQTGAEKLQNFLFK